MKPKHLLAVTALGAMAGWLGCTTPQTGLTDSGLRPCPASPNCVATPSTTSIPLPTVCRAPRPWPG